jgi:hypothetical protein
MCVLACCCISGCPWNVSIPPAYSACTASNGTSSSQGGITTGALVGPGACEGVEAVGVFSGGDAVVVGASPWGCAQPAIASGIQRITAAVPSLRVAPMSPP